MASESIRVRVAVAVAENGAWTAYGRGGEDDAEKRHVAIENLRGARGLYGFVWVEADVPLPREPVVPGEVALATNPPEGAPARAGGETER